MKNWKGNTLKITFKNSIKMKGICIDAEGTKRLKEGETYDLENVQGNFNIPVWWIEEFKNAYDQKRFMLTSKMDESELAKSKQNIPA